MATLDVGSPVTGTVWKVERQPGDIVHEGDTIMILESMKMEIPLEATADGVLAEIKVQPGEAVEEDQVLCTIQT